ncbi:MAG: ABC transporter permease [Oscillospiraceae bacterium]|nr:ABC transporter permease [Oscillospiraceae bacterium]
MIRLLKSEYLKTRRRFVFLTAIVMTLAMLAWTFHGSFKGDTLRLGWMLLLYQMPLANTVFMSLLSMIVASRLCDLEHRGAMVRKLASAIDKGKIYDAKLLYGLAVVLFAVVFSWAATIALGYYKGFWAPFPMKLYLFYLLFTAAPTVVIYILQHTLSICVKNQTVSFFTGALGAFGGMFALYLQNLPWLRRILIWGWYGALQFVGLWGWTKESRYADAYFEIMPFDWILFGVLIAAGAAIYILGRAWFKRKEF